MTRLSRLEELRAEGDQPALWIDENGDGRLHDETMITARLRLITGRGCGLCDAALDGTEFEAAIKIDFLHGGIPLLDFDGDGVPVCQRCVRWIDRLHVHARQGRVSEFAFEVGELVAPYGSTKLLRVAAQTLTGIPRAGIWWPAYRCDELRLDEGVVADVEVVGQVLYDEYDLSPFPRHLLREARRTRVPPPPALHAGVEERQLPKLEDLAPVRLAPSLDVRRRIS